MTPAMNSWPTEVLVATEYITITIDGGIRMPSAPEVVMTPAPKRFGKPCLTIAGRMIEPIATTVAGDEPDTAANSAQAITPASARPPCQWPTIDVAKLIMRRATPPWVRKLPARMKNGIAMISKLLDAGEQLQRHRRDRHRRHREQEGEHGEAERDRDRHAGQHQPEQQQEDDQRRRDVQPGGEAQHRQRDHRQRQRGDQAHRARHDRPPRLASAGCRLSRAVRIDVDRRRRSRCPSTWP